MLLLRALHVAVGETVPCVDTLWFRRLDPCVDIEPDVTTRDGGMKSGGSCGEEAPPLPVFLRRKLPRNPFFLLCESPYVLAPELDVMAVVAVLPKRNLW